MTSSPRIRAALVLLALLVPGLRAGDLSFHGTTDKETALYQPGETMVFHVQLLDGGKPAAGKKLRWTRMGDDAKTETGEAVSSGTEPLTVSTSLETPGFVFLRVEALDDAENPLVNADDSKKQPVRFEGGAGVEPDKLEGAPEPADFDAFWAAQKARLSAVPVRATLAEIPSTNPDFEAFDVKIDCAGGKPVSGYLTLPKNAAPKSLKAHGTYMGYGVASATPGYEKDTLLFNINAHGIENGQDPGYYDGLKNGDLKGYAFRNDENAKPETSSFNGMVLRVLRSLEFLKSRPEWNGRDLAVSGGSQGGFQSLAGAALDRDVTQCTVSVPWLCDLGGIGLGRLRGWRPDPAAALGYDDSANLGKRITCPVVIDAGLGDRVCPPSGICVLFNGLKGAASRQLTFIQGKTHPYTPPNPQKFTLR